MRWWQYCTDLSVVDSEVRHEVSLTEDILRSAGVSTLVSQGDGQDGVLVTVLYLEQHLVNRQSCSLHYILYFC